MLGSDKEAFIRLKALEHGKGDVDKIAWSIHAIGKLRREHLRKDDIEHAFRTCDLVEDYSMEGRSLPGCLVLGYVGSEPIHAVLAIDKDNDRIFVITVYRPVEMRWKNGWKKRK